MIETLDDFAPTPLDSRFHRHIPTPRERRHIFIEREELRSCFMQELRKHLFRLPTSQQERYTPLLQVSAQPIQAIQKEPRSSFATRRSGNDARIQNEDREPLLDPHRQRVKRRVVVQAQVSTEPMESAAHATPADFSDDAISQICW